MTREDFLTDADLILEEKKANGLTTEELVILKQLENGLTVNDIIPQTELRPQAEFRPLPELKIPKGVLTETEEASLREIVSIENFRSMDNLEQEKIIKDFENLDLKEFIKKHQSLKSKIYSWIKK